MDGSRWTMAFDIKPTDGYRFVMDGLPGVIHSGDDFWNQRAGIVITETTITGFFGYDFDGILNSFVRAKRCSIRPRSMMWRKFLRTETTAVTPTTGSSLTRKR